MQTPMSHDIYTYLESACHHEQNGSQKFILQTVGSQSYGNSKLATWKIMIKKTGSCSSSLVYGKQIFWMRQRMVPLSAGTNGE